MFDTTLRDGEQSPGASLTADEKVEVARQLDQLGVDVIEAGFAISSVGDFEAIRRIAQEVRRPAVASLCRAQQVDIDRAWEALKEAERPRCHVFLATSPIHMTKKLKKTPGEVLAQIAEAVSYARRMFPDVEFSPEDATRSDPVFLALACEVAAASGANVINIPDTVGYTTPSEYADLVRLIKSRVAGVTISVHCHNDLGLAVANSLAALEAGAEQVECTVNGIGERAGNASLEELVMAVRTRADRYPFDCGIDSRRLVPLSQLVSRHTGMPVQPNKAIVGANAFAHEAGIHQDGVLKERTTYEIMSPEEVGWDASKLVLGKHSGRLRNPGGGRILGISLDETSFLQAFTRFKQEADVKKQLSDGDLTALVGEVQRQWA
ncbi:MAG: 2-isopropylmalate synthase [Firmicutes bacterium]|nr:2-isopropylmalate synthase [Bacillota bacterium]